MGKPEDYESAVYDEDAARLAEAIAETCRADFEAIPDRRVRTAIIASALITAAQVLDGNRMPEETKVIKPDGIASLMQWVLIPKQAG